MRRAPHPLFPLAVIGQGAVSPAGSGVASLSSLEAIQETEIASLRRPETVRFPVLRVDPKLSALAAWAREPRLRRASPVATFLVEAAAQALAGWERAPGARLGVVCAFFSGCPAYSRRFFEQTIRKGQSFASPALFPETVYNSPLSHLASIFGIAGSAYAVVGDESAWGEALRVAATWLALDEADAVLVLAGEELDLVTIEAFAAARWLRRGASFRPAEGAAALLVARGDSSASSLVEAIYPPRPYRDGPTALRAAREVFSEFDPELPILSSVGHSWLEPFEAQLAGARLEPVQGAYLGESMVATAGWNTLRALRGPALGSRLLPLWGQNHQISALKLSRR